MTKILIVDDSAFMRQIFKKIIENEPGLTLVGTARHGKQALQMIPKLKPDVITLDIEMPVKNGLETLEEIMRLEKPIPTIMCSSLDDRETVLKALELGAFDFIPKPSKSLTLKISEIAHDLTIKIKAAAILDKKPSTVKPVTLLKKKIHKAKSPDQYPIIAIGTSSGGPKALKAIIPAFPADLPAAILIVQHMPPGFTASLAKRLDQNSAIKVKEAMEDDQLQPGLALIAPGGYHLEVTDNNHILLNQKPTKWGVRPCVDYMLISASQVFTHRMIGVILTGMGQDGAEGMKVIKANNGYGIIEDKSTAQVYGMPGATIRANAYDQIVPLDQIPEKIIDVIERRF